MPRWAQITLAALAVAVLFGAFYFLGLRERLLRLAKLQPSDEAARRAVVQPPVATPTDAPAKAKLFWLSEASPEVLEPVDVELPLSAEPAQRARQLLDALITKAPAPERRTLPPDGVLIEFYLLPGGVAVADFSDNLATDMPSGILSEHLAIESIRRTLEANMSGLHELKILIQGQEAETLAGHLDLTGYFALTTPEAGAPARQAPKKTP